MAEFLIKVMDATHVDPKKDASGCYKRSDIVQAYADGVCTEPPASNSKFYIVKVPGFPLLEQYDESLLDDNGEVERRARWVIDLDVLTRQQRDTLNTSRVLTLNSLGGLLIDKAV